MARRRTAGRGGFIVAGLGFGLAAGIALGTLFIAPTLTAGEEHGAPPEANDAAEAPVSEREQIAVAQLEAADTLVEHLAPPALEGRLNDRPVLILRTADAEEDHATGLMALTESAGGLNAGTITLTPKFFSPAGADELKTIAATTLPAGAELSTDTLDSGTHAGQLLGAALLLDPETGEERASSEDRALVLQSLRDAGFIDYPDGTILPAQAVVMVTGSASDELTVDNQLAFITALQGSGAATVAAGPAEAAADDAFLGRLRAAEGPVSTVDSINLAWARTAAVLAAAEQIAGSGGDYGVAAAADAFHPPL